MNLFHAISTTRLLVRQDESKCHTVQLHIFDCGVIDCVVIHIQHFQCPSAIGVFIPELIGHQACCCVLKLVGVVPPGARSTERVPLGETSTTMSSVRSGALSTRLTSAHSTFKLVLICQKPAVVSDSKSPSCPCGMVKLSLACMVSDCTCRSGSTGDQLAAASTAAPASTIPKPKESRTQ